MIIRLLKKIHSKNSSLRIALASQRRKYRPSDNSFWGQVYSNIMEIEKYYITINFIERFLIKKNFRFVKAYLDLVTYWHFYNKKSSERIILESSKFFFSSNKEKRLFSSYVQSISNQTLNSILEDVDNPSEKWSLKFSLPLILYDLLSPDYTTKELNLLGNWFNTPSPKYIWINNQNLDFSSFLNDLRTKISLLEIPSVNKCFIVTGDQPIQKTVEFKNNQILVQNLGAALISQLVPKVNGVIVDVCAAPGNKTVQLFDKYSIDDECNLYAGDLPGSRYAILLKRATELLDVNFYQKTKENTNKIKFGKKNKKLILQSWDGTNLPFQNLFADLVFIDAPCTGSGTLGSKPDIRQQLDENFLLKHIETQKKLLREANRILKRNGLLFYTTCSLLKEENESQILDFLDEFKNYEIIPLNHNFNSSKLIFEGSIRLFPPLSKTDGFFAILLQKK